MSRSNKKLGPFNGKHRSTGGEGCQRPVGWALRNPMWNMKAITKEQLPDLVACGLVGLFGLAAIWMGASYPVGSVTRMGAGFFPVAISAIVIGLAVAAAIETLMSETSRGTFKWRPLIFISVAILAWTQLIDTLGLIPSTFALILISGLAKQPFRPVSLILTATFLSVAGYLVFVLGLHMPLTLLGR